MKNILTVVVLVLMFMFSVEIDLNKEIPVQISTAENAQAFIGRPATPMSYAGVARRTTYRRAATTTAVVATTASASAAAAASAAQQPTTVVVVNQASPAPVSAVPIGTVVQTLPSGCKSVVVGGVKYTDCAGAFYKTAFQGNNLVYVVVESPL